MAKRGRTNSKVVKTGLPRTQHGFSGAGFGKARGTGKSVSASPTFKGQMARGIRGSSKRGSMAGAKRLSASMAGKVTPGGGGGKPGRSQFVSGVGLGTRRGSKRGR